MQIKHLKDIEYLETLEGFMRPLVFGKKLMAFHLEIPPEFKVEPHTHEGEGFIYCLSGELEVVTSNNGKISISAETAMLIPPGIKVGVENKNDKPVKAIIVGSPPMVKSTEELKKLIESYESKTKESK